VLEVLPRDDLFQTPVDELFSTVMSIVQIQERNKIRVFLRKDPYGRFCYCLAYVPRDIYSTEVRQKIQQVLMDRLKASDCEFWTFFSESVLARVQLILRVDPKNRIDIDPLQLEKEVVQACRSWQDDYAAWWSKASAKPTAPTCWRTSRKASRPVTASVCRAFGGGRHAAPAEPDRSQPAGDELLPAAGPGVRPARAALQAVPRRHPAGAVRRAADPGKPRPARAG
jgi:hypothetical protein